jgi:hypothetical protein
MNNKVVKTVTSEAAKFYTQHESAILTGGTIGFSFATSALIFRNARAILEILDDTRDTLWMCNTQEEKNRVYAVALKDLAPLITPIVLCQGATVACAIMNKKHSDKLEAKLTETASALSIAQAVIAQYEAFQKQAEESLGPKEYEKIQKKIYKDQEVDGRRFTYLTSEGAPGEVLFINKYDGKPFWSTISTIENAAIELRRMVTPNKQTGLVPCDMATLDDFYGLIGNKDLTENVGELALRFGYVAGVEDNKDISVYFADTHYTFPNGTRIPAFEMYLYPEPGCVDWNC